MLSLGKRSKITLNFSRKHWLSMSSFIFLSVLFIKQAPTVFFPGVLDYSVLQNETKFKKNYKKKIPINKWVDEAPSPQDTAKVLHCWNCTFVQASQWAIWRKREECLLASWIYLPHLMWQTRFAQPMSSLPGQVSVNCCLAEWWIVTLGRWIECGVSSHCRGIKHGLPHCKHW